MIGRGLALVAVLAVAWLVVRWWEHRRTVVGALPPGITVVTAPGCTLCDPAVEALRGTGTVAPIRVVDASATPLRGVRSVPTVLAVRADGSIALQRSGASAIRDAASLAAAIA